MNQIAADSIPTDETRPLPKPSDEKAQELDAIGRITTGQVLHFLDSGTSKLSTDPRKILMRFIKEAVTHYIKWTNPKADDAYSPDEIIRRATQRQTPYSATPALRQASIPKDRLRQRPQTCE